MVSITVFCLKNPLYASPTGVSYLYNSPYIQYKAWTHNCTCYSPIAADPFSFSQFISSHPDIAIKYTYQKINILFTDVPDPLHLPHLYKAWSHWKTCTLFRHTQDELHLDEFSPSKTVFTLWGSLHASCRASLYPARYMSHSPPSWLCSHDTPTDVPLCMHEKALKRWSIKHRQDCKLLHDYVVLRMEFQSRQLSPTKTVEYRHYVPCKPLEFNSHRSCIVSGFHLALPWLTVNSWPILEHLLWHASAIFLF